MRKVMMIMMDDDDDNDDEGDFDVEHGDGWW